MPSVQSEKGGEKKRNKEGKMMEGRRRRDANLVIIYGRIDTKFIHAAL